MVVAFYRKRVSIKRNNVPCPIRNILIQEKCYGAVAINRLTPINIIKLISANQRVMIHNDLHHRYNTATTHNLAHKITCNTRLSDPLARKINPLNPELNPICYLLALLAHHFLHVSRIRVKSLTIRLHMSYVYGAPILDVSRSHTTTHHSR